jgi:microcystin-dependent protein
MSSYNEYLRQRNCCTQGAQGPEGQQGVPGAQGAQGPTSTNGVPTGAIMLFGTTVPPSGWLECDGSQVLISNYQNLFLAIGCTFGCIPAPYFLLPDLRGYFVRGWSNTSSIDSGRAFASIQQDQLQKHKHIASNNDCQNYALVNGTGTGNFNTWCDTNGIATAQPGGALTGDGTQVNTDPANNANVGTETRPINIALMYCIKT